MVVIGAEQYQWHKIGLSVHFPYMHTHFILYYRNSLLMKEQGKGKSHP